MPNGFQQHLQTEHFTSSPMISRDEAAARCGLSTKQFKALVKERIFPDRHPKVKLWDRKRLYECMRVRKFTTSDINEPGFVYFMKMGDFIKIGWSSWPPNRRIDLQISSPYDIIILGAFPGTLNDEAAVQSWFQHAHKRGEWYRKTPGLVAYLAWLKIVWRGSARTIKGELDNVIHFYPSKESA